MLNLKNINKNIKREKKKPIQFTNFGVAIVSIFSIFVFIDFFFIFGVSKLSANFASGRIPVQNDN